MDDEPKVRQRSSAALIDEYQVREAGSGAAPLEILNEADNVLMLDRQMVDLSGDGVLDWMREAGYDSPIAMVTATVPDIDVPEMGVDAYVLKPMDVDELRDTIETHLLRKEYDDVIREYYALVSMLTAPRSTMRNEALNSDERSASAENGLEGSSGHCGRLKRRSGPGRSRMLSEHPSRPQGS